MNHHKLLLPVICLVLLMLPAIGCNLPTPTPTPTNTPTPTPLHTPTPTNTPTPSSTPTPTNTPTPTPTPTPSAPPTVNEFRITTDSEVQGQPAIFGDRMVWADHRHDVIDVYAYDLATEKETHITTNEEDSFFLIPLIAGDLVVWEGKDNFYGYHLDTEDADEFSVTSYDSLYVGCPAVCGLTFRSGSMVLTYGARPHVALSERALVWSDEVAEDIRDILAFDLEQDTRIRITDDTPAQKWPATAGNLIVWMDERNDEGDIYAYDLDAQEEFLIVTAPLTQTMPDTDGSLIVWVDKRDGNDDIYGYNLETQTEFSIVTGPAKRAMPVVQGDFVIWMEEHNEDWDIYAYDLFVGEKFPIVTKNGWQGNPRIWGNTVVWTDRRDKDNQDIYGATLEY